MSLSDYRFALEFRAELQRLVKEEVERQRPRYQMATVVSIDRVLRKCTVQFPSDTTTSTVSMGSIQPSSVGQVVRVEGLSGDRYIADVLGPAYETLETRVTSIEANPGATSNLLNNGGFEYGSTQHWSTFWSSGGVTHGLDSVGGNAYSGAYSYQATVTATDANMVLSQTVYPCEPGQVIAFSYAVKKTGTATVSSRLEILTNTLATNCDYFASGLSQITVLSDTPVTTGYVVRRALFTVPAGHYFFRPIIRSGCSVFTSATTINYDDLTASRVIIQPPGSDPISFGGQVSIPNNFDTAGLTGAGWDAFRLSLRGQHLLTGGGIRAVTSTGISWNDRFIIIDAGKDNAVSFAGHFEMDLPADGTVITGVGGASNQTVASGAIPLGAWVALYYILPFGNAQTSVAANYRLVSYSSTFTVPNTWVLVALRNGDTMAVKWGDGREQDYWRAPSLLNSWINYVSGTHEDAGYKKENGWVYIRGLVSSGTFHATATTGRIFLLPAGFRPVTNQLIFCVLSNSTDGRVDIFTDGSVQAVLGASAWVNLTGIMFQAQA
jgi:hypothetical protein